MPLAGMLLLSQHTSDLVAGKAGCRRAGLLAEEEFAGIDLYPLCVTAGASLIRQRRTTSWKTCIKMYKIPPWKNCIFNFMYN